MDSLFRISTIIALTAAAGLDAASPFFGDPPDANHPWAVHDQNRPQPAIVTPGENVGDAPSDAIMLFDGSLDSFENWKHEKPQDKRKADWVVVDGVLMAQPGASYLMTKEQFGDMQLHVEWASPEDGAGSNQNRGNSGVFFMNGMVEVQVLDNYENLTYADGTAGAVYGINPPAVNALRPTGQWQSYDIIFRRPITRDGKVLDPGSLTVMVNGVVVQDSTPLEGGGGYKVRSDLARIFPEQGSLKLQDHGSPVRFRNIWYRSLPPRELDGGTDGFLSIDRTLAKRAETAAAIRADAEAMQGIAKALRLLESLIYQSNDAAQVDAEGILAKYLDSLSGKDNSQMAAEKTNVQKVYRALTYLEKYKLLPGDNGLQAQVRAIAVENGWVKKKEEIRGEAAPFNCLFS